MISFLAQKLIPNSHNTEDPIVRGAYGTLCSGAGIVLNLMLFVLKYLAGIISGSIAIVADSLNSLSDAGSSIITLVGFKLASKKPDKEHPFGHGRMEALSGLAVSVLILLMGVELIKSSVEKILHPQPIESSATVIVILIISVLVKCYMALYNHNIGKKIHSAAMKATAADSLSDAASTFVVFVCTILSRYTSLPLDGWVGVLVAALVLYAGYGAVKETVDPLLGQAPEKEFIDRIEKLVLSHEQVLGIHDLVVHDYGPGRVMITLHAEVPGDGDIFEMHDLIDLVEKELCQELGCEATIHMDPLAVNDELTMSLKKVAQMATQSVDERLNIHDFRIVTGPTHTNLVFDVLTPADYKMSDEALKNAIQQNIWEENKSYFIVIKVDHDYVGRV